MKVLGESLVYLVLVSIVLIRLLTETLGILPRLFNGIDMVLIPAIIGLSVISCLMRGGQFASVGLEAWMALFLAVWFLSTLLNIDDILPAATSLYLVGHLLPVAFAVAVFNLQFSERFSRGVTAVLVGLTMFGVSVGLSQIGELADNPDALVFSFGTNSNQTAFFLSLVLSLLLARWFCGVASLWQKLFVAGLLPLFFLAGFKAAWVSYPLVVVVTFLTAGFQQRGRLIRALGSAGVFLAAVALIVVFVPLPERHYFEGFAQFDPATLGRFVLVTNLPEVLLARPWGLVVGVGPGTFSSRAFRIFGDLPNRGSATDVTFEAIPPTYMTRLAADYVVPLVTMTGWQLSSGTVEWPFSSYISLLAETGVIGFVAMVSIYVLTWSRLMRAAAQARTRESRALSLAASMVLLMLLSISVLDNYLEHTRLASLAWLMAALAWSATKNERLETTRSLPAWGSHEIREFSGRQ